MKTGATTAVPVVFRGPPPPDAAAVHEQYLRRGNTRRDAAACVRRFIPHYPPKARSW